MKRRTESELGFSLVEVLLTVIILGTGIVSILGSMETSIFAASLHRKQADEGAIVRAASEYVKGAAYDTTCANSAANYLVGFTPADTNYTVSVTGGEFWNTSLAVPAFQSWTTPCTDGGFQRISLQVLRVDQHGTATINVIETLQIVKRKQ